MGSLRRRSASKRSEPGLGTNLQGTLVSMQGRQSASFWKVTMSSWFISPWEAARFSLEAQRLIAIQLFSFPPRTKQPHQEETSDYNKSAVPGLGSSADLPSPPRPRETAQARTVAAHNATGVVRKATGIRKIKSNKSKRTNQKKRGVRPQRSRRFAGVRPDKSCSPRVFSRELSDDSGGSEPGLAGS
jgi:hypothetical protein